MDFQQLKYFTTVAEIGKISEAAERLSVSVCERTAGLSEGRRGLGKSPGYCGTVLCHRCG